MNFSRDIASSSIIVKVRYIKDDEVIARKMLIDKNAKLGEFHEKTRLRFGISSDVEIEICYRDEDYDRVIVSFDEELLIAIKSNPPAKFELTTKSISNGVQRAASKVPREEAVDVVETTSSKIETPEDETPKSVERLIKARLTYPLSQLVGNVGDFIEVKFKSKDLKINNISNKSIWGTKVYTNDTDMIKALVHSYPIKLNDIPIYHDIIATVKILPGQSSYVGSYCNGINSHDYDSWPLSYIIEDIKIVEGSKVEMPKDGTPKSVEKLIKARLTYPLCKLVGNDRNVGDFYEVELKSEYLVTNNINNKSIWGTKVYTGDTDIIKALVHSYPVKLTDTPPNHDIIATVKILPGQSSYIGTYCNGIDSRAYCSWPLSYTIEDIRIVGGSKVEMPKKLIKARLTYPFSKLVGNIGDFYEIELKSKNLTINNINNLSIWGTIVYTNDTDMIKALVHSHPVKLTDTPPNHNIIATVKILPGQSSYMGSHCNGIDSQSYGSWPLSYTIEGIRYDEIVAKLDIKAIFF